MAKQVVTNQFGSINWISDQLLSYDDDMIGR